MSYERRVEIHPGCEAVYEFDPDLTFECVDSCIWCCQHSVLLYDHDLLELAAHAALNDATTAFRGRSFVKREGEGSGRPHRRRRCGVLFPLGGRPL